MWFADDDYDDWNSVASCTEIEEAKTVDPYLDEIWEASDDLEAQREEFACQWDAEFDEWWAYYNQAMCDQLDPEVKGRVHWSKYIQAAVIWVNLGAEPSAAPTTRSDIEEVLYFWYNCPAEPKALLEPLVSHWKVWAFNPKPPYERKQEREAAEKAAAKALEDQRKAEEAERDAQQAVFG